MDICQDCNTLYCTVIKWIALCYNRLHCNTVHCTVVQCIALDYSALHCSQVHYTALQCTQHVTHVTCHFKKNYKVLELLGGESAINGATPSSFPLASFQSSLPCVLEAEMHISH